MKKTAWPGGGFSRPFGSA